MNAYLYIEGGAVGPDSKFLKIRCQEAFHRLLDRMGYQKRQPRLVACGGRQDVYDRFCVEHSLRKAAYVAMWIDSEEPIRTIGPAERFQIRSTGFLGSKAFTELQNRLWIL